MVNNMVQWTPGMSLDTIERQVILAAFRHFRGNKTATANSLGIAIRTLDNKLEQYKADGEKEEISNADRQATRDEFNKRQRGFTTGPDGEVVPLVERRIYTKADDEARKANGKRPAQGGESNESESEAGLRMESASDDSAQLPVSVPLGAQVQSVSSRAASGNRNGKRR